MSATCPAFCISCCVSALNGSGNKEVVDHASYLLHLLTEGGGCQLRYESDAAMIRIQWPGNPQCVSLSLGHVSLFLNKVISRDYRVRTIDGWFTKVVNGFVTKRISTCDCQFFSPRTVVVCRKIPINITGILLFIVVVVVEQSWAMEIIMLRMKYY